MFREQFEAFMNDQLNEIRSYKKAKQIKRPHLTSNECVFEWIENHAENFRKCWEKDNIKK